jgi:hypothetical protein
MDDADAYEKSSDASGTPEMQRRRLLSDVSDEDGSPGSGGSSGGGSAYSPVHLNVNMAFDDHERSYPNPNYNPNRGYDRGHADGGGVGDGDDDVCMHAADASPRDGLSAPQSAHSTMKATISSVTGRISHMLDGGQKRGPRGGGASGGGSGGGGGGGRNGSGVGRGSRYSALTSEDEDDDDEDDSDMVESGQRARHSDPGDVVTL